MRRNFESTEQNSLDKFINKRHEELKTLLGLDSMHLERILDTIEHSEISGSSKEVVHDIADKLLSNNKKIEDDIEKLTTENISEILHLVKPKLAERLQEWRHVNAVSSETIYFMRDYLHIEDEDIIKIVNFIEDELYHESHLSDINEVSKRYLERIKYQTSTSDLDGIDQMNGEMEEDMIRFFEKLLEDTSSEEIIKILQDLQEQTQERR